MSLSHETAVCVSSWAQEAWSKFNKSDLLNTMVEPKSSWATRTLPSKTQWPRTRCDTCCRACGVCAYVWIHISLNWNSFWLTLAHKLISLLTSFHWLILRRVATASLSSTQWFWMILQMVSHFLFFLTSQERIDRLVVRGNCRRRLFTLKSERERLYDKESCWSVVGILTSNRCIQNKRSGSKQMTHGKKREKKLQRGKLKALSPRQ